MPLDNPKPWDFWTTFKYKKQLLYAVIGLALLAGVLFGIQQTRSWWGTRKIDKLKANVNSTMGDLKNAQANIAKDKQDEAVQLDRVKSATNAVIEATNSTNAAKTETNRALGNLANAVNANHQVDVTAEDLHKRLQELDQ